MKLFRKNSSLSSVSVLSREALLLSFLKDLSHREESNLRNLLRNRFEADFTGLNLHKPEGRQADNVLDNMLNTVTFYLEKQGRADARELALRIIKMPIRALVLTDTSVAPADDQDLQITLSVNAQETQFLCLSNRSSANGEFRGAVFASALRQAQVETPNMTLAELTYNFISKQLESNFSKLALFTFVTLYGGIELDSAEEKNKFSQLITAEFPMQELPRALLVKALQHADNRMEFNKQFDRLLVLSMIRLVLKRSDHQEFIRLTQSPALEAMITACLAVDWPHQAAVLTELLGVYREIAAGVAFYTDVQGEAYQAV